MHLVFEYRQFARDYRRLATILTEPADKQALELMATGWEKTAEKREVLLRSQQHPGYQPVPDEATCVVPCPKPVALADLGSEGLGT